MTTKPQPKKEVSITFTKKPIIAIDSTKDALDDFREFCQSIMSFESMPNSYHLWIDSRYDFDEVVEYIKNY